VKPQVSALKWPELDLKTGTVLIKASRTTVGAEVIDRGTKNGDERTIDLDARTVQALRTHLRRQAKDRLRAGEGWAGGKPGEDGYVFVDETGEPPKPHRLGDLFGQAQQDLGLKQPLVLHGLRHTSATIALSAGVSIVTVSERLGHSMVSITLDIYSHRLPKDGAAAARLHRRGDLRR
jgi:integrase